MYQWWASVSSGEHARPLTTKMELHDELILSFKLHFFFNKKDNSNSSRDKITHNNDSNENNKDNENTSDNHLLQLKISFKF